jgi:hypothetical protein
MGVDHFSPAARSRSNSASLEVIPTLKGDATRAGDSEPVAIPRGVASAVRGAVELMIVDELFTVSEESQRPPLEVDSTIPHGQIEG